MRDNFARSLLLTRFMLRRERITSTIWIVLLVFVVVGLVPGMQNTLDADSLAGLIPVLDNPVMVSMMGPAYAAQYGTFGAMYTNMMMLFTALTVGLMNIFLIVRHTRTDEEKGRYEVLRSLPLGRLSNLASAMITAIIVNLILFVVISFGMFFSGDESMGLTGSLLWGASLAATGLVFAALAALFSQMSSNSRGALGYSFAALAIIYLLRAPGDMNSDLEILSLISPLGLVLRTQAYMGNYWWPIIIMLLTAVVVTIIALRVNLTRDIDQGVIPARPGRATGSALMRSPYGFTFKLLRTGFIVWLAGMFLLGASYAAVLDDIDSFVAQNELYQQLILGPAGVELAQDLGPEETLAAMQAAVAAAGFSIAELFASMVNSIMGMVVTVPLIMFILKAKAEEKDVRTEFLLSASLSRTKYLAGFALIAFISAILIQLALAFGLYLVGSSMLPDENQLSLAFLLEANLVFVPALWVMTGVALLLVGLLPKASGIIWGYFGFSFLVVFIGRMGIFPDWISYLTPMGFIPQLPMEETNFVTLGALTAVAAVLSALGFFFYNRRDINAITN